MVWLGTAALHGWGFGLQEICTLCFPLGKLADLGSGWGQGDAQKGGGEANTRKTGWILLTGEKNSVKGILSPEKSVRD